MSDRATRQDLQSVPAILKRGWYGFAIVGVFSFFINLLVLASPIYMMQVFDRVLLTRHVDTLIYLTIAAGLAVTVLGLLETLRSRILVRIGSWWDRANRRNVLFSSVDATLKSGEPVTFGFQDLHTVRTFIASPGIIPIFDSPWVPIFILVIAILHPYLGLLAFSAAAALFLLALANDLVMRRALGGISEQQVKLSGATQLAIRHADVIRAMGMFSALARSNRLKNDIILDAHQVAADRSAAVTGFSKFLRISVQIGILGLGAWLVIKGELTSGGMIAGSIILGRTLAPVEQAIGSWRGLIAARDAYRRLAALTARTASEVTAMSLPAPAGHVSVEGLAYVPPGAAKPVLQGISFNLEPGTVLAVTGPSAAGKSTLCRLLVGSLIPSAGHVRLDGAEISQWDRDDIGRHLGYLPQTVDLLAGTVKENIARYGSVSDEAVFAAAKASGCHEMILQLPQGYETEIGDSGAYLSGGQCQRIGLARALFGAPRLVVLDEANANLDNQGEAALLDAIQQLKTQGAVVVLVTHKRSMLGPVDKIGVMQAGRLDRIGNRDRVLQELAEPKGDLQEFKSASPEIDDALPRSGGLQR